MSKLKDELLKRRFRIIAGYPEMERHNLKQGDIITRSESAMYADTTQDGNPVAAIDHDFFPAIFRELHWSEDREFSDLPEYVKGIGGYFKNKIFKIAHPSQNGREWHIDNEIEHQTFLRWATDFIPADESEYNDYVNSKQP